MSRVTLRSGQVLLALLLEDPEDEQEWMLKVDVVGRPRPLALVGPECLNVEGGVPFKELNAQRVQIHPSRLELLVDLAWRLS